MFVSMFFSSGVARRDLRIRSENFFWWHMHLCSLIHTLLFITVFSIFSSPSKIFYVLVNEGAEYDQCMTLKCFTPDYTKTCENKHPFHDYYICHIAGYLRHFLCSFGVFKFTFYMTTLEHVFRQILTFIEFSVAFAFLGSVALNQ